MARRTSFDDDEDIPDDFFDELADNKFLDELLENVGPDESNDILDNDSVDLQHRRESASPLMERCLKEIDKLTKDIQRKKKKLHRELMDKERSSKRSESPTGRRSRSPPSHRIRRHSPSNSKIKKRSRSRDRTRGQMSRVRHSRSPIRRSKSRSPLVTDRRRRVSRSPVSPHRRRARSRNSNRRTATSNTKAMTFLEELNLKFAEQGQSFPEKDLLLAQKAQENNPQMAQSYNQQLLPNPAAFAAHPMPAYPMMPMDSTYDAYNHYGQNPMVFNSLGPAAGMPMDFGNSQIIGPNPMAMMQSQSLPMPLDAQLFPPGTMNTEVVGPTAFEMQNKLPKIKAELSGSDVLLKPATNRSQAMSRCEAAIKVLRAEENRVPRFRFTLTRTSMQLANNYDNGSPLHSLHNVEFERTSKTGKGTNPLHALNGRTKEVTKLLGFNCGLLFSKIRMKELSNKVLSELEDTNKEKLKKLEKPIKKADMQIQTEPVKCEECAARAEIQYVSKGCQKSGPTTQNVRVQTGDEDYRQPIMKLLSNMTAAQLLSMVDFAKIISKERPNTTEEMFHLREKLMDIYNLGLRDTDTVRENQRKRQLEREIEEEQIAKLIRENRGNNWNNNIGMDQPLSEELYHRMPNNCGPWTGNDVPISNARQYHRGHSPPSLLDIPQILMDGPSPSQVGVMRIDREFIMDRQRIADEHMELLESEEMEKERELRYQQAQYERDLRAFEMEEDRLRRIEEINRGIPNDEYNHMMGAGQFNWRGGAAGGGGGRGGGYSRGASAGGRPFRGRYGR